ncbi:unnamed protein product, partial [Ectocarpus sp. 12 AP-2014]
FSPPTTGGKEEEQGAAALPSLHLLLAVVLVSSALAVGSPGAAARAGEENEFTITIAELKLPPRTVSSSSAPHLSSAFPPVDERPTPSLSSLPPPSCNATASTPPSIESSELR